MHIEKGSYSGESPLRAGQGLPYAPHSPHSPTSSAQPENIRKLQMAQLELIQKQQQKKQKEEQQKVGEMKRGIRKERGEGRGKRYEREPGKYRGIINLRPHSIIMHRETERETGREGEREGGRAQIVKLPDELNVCPSATECSMHAVHTHTDTCAHT